MHEQNARKGRDFYIDRAYFEIPGSEHLAGDCVMDGKRKLILPITGRQKSVFCLQG